jgi:retinol dehydrogenase-12
MMLPKPLLYDGTYFTNVAFSLFSPLAVLYTSVTHVLQVANIWKVGKQLTGKPFELPPRSAHDTARLPLAIITGSNTGIGFELALNFVLSGYNVILACRSRDKGEEAAKTIDTRAQHGTQLQTVGKAMFVTPCDLSSFQSIHSFVDEVRRCHLYNGCLNVLVNNAGINFNGVSGDGLDLCFQSNFVGHYLLTRLLLPDLKKARNYVTYPEIFEAGRIVNLSSVMHHFASPLPLSKEEWKNQCIDIPRHLKPENRFTYSHSKVAAILFTTQLNKLYQDSNIHAISVNPGAVNSDIWRHINPTLFKYIVGPVFRLLYLTPAQASSGVFAAATGVNRSNSTYFQPYWLPKSISSTPFPVFEMLGPFIGSLATEPRLPQGDDTTKSAENLWMACEDVLHAKNVHIK